MILLGACIKRWHTFRGIYFNYPDSLSGTGVYDVTIKLHFSRLEGTKKFAYEGPI